MCLSAIRLSVPRTPPPPPVIKQKPKKLTPRDLISIILLGVMISSESITTAETRQGALFHKNMRLKTTKLH